jgi:putative spermidine/putrescine transport system permease protein
MRARQQARQSWFRRAVLGVTGAVFAIPLVAMLEFTTRGPGGTRSGQTWALLTDPGAVRVESPELYDGLRASAALVVLTVALMLLLLVPTMTWVRLRLPRWQRPLEFVCLLPLTIPAIVLVVGLAPVYAWVTYFLGESSATLFLAYTVLVLPYAYRALDAGLSAIDVRTLSEAARGLGASWFTVLWRVVLPNLRTAVLSASFLSVALVLGEFTIASLLNRENLQVGINQLGQRDSSLAVAVSLLALVLAFVLLLVLGLLASRAPGGRRLLPRRAGAATVPAVPTAPASAVQQ